MQFYNQLKHQKEEFITITPGEVKMYACVLRFITIFILEMLVLLSL
jgi:hypothetical protein